MSGLFGMAADQILSVNAVTADGRFVTASETENTDLFWALRGGGGSTFAIVTSMIIKAHPDLPSAAATWSFTSANYSDAAMSGAFKAWLKYFPSNADLGIYSYLNLIPLGGGEVLFDMVPFLAPNKTLAEAQSILQPWLDDVKALGISVTPDWEYYESYYGVVQNQLTVGSANTIGSLSDNRLYPRANFENATLLNATASTLWEQVKAGYVILPYNLAPTYERGGKANNSVNPAWRSTVAYIITAGSLNYSQPASEVLDTWNGFLDGPMKAQRDLTPGSGGYLNEANRLERNFQWSFFGSNYPRLLEVKKKYDPFNLFYAKTGVGSEFFDVRSFDDLPNENGLLCANRSPSLYVAEGPTYTPSR